MKSLIKCARCRGGADGGVVVTILGQPTGHNHERYILCPDCLPALRSVLAENPENPVMITKQEVADRFVRKGEAQ